MNTEYIQKFYNKYEKDILPRILEFENASKNWSSGNKAYKNRLKELFLDEILNCFDFINIHYTQVNESQIKSLVQCDLFKPEDKITTDDYFCGTYKDVPFYIVEIEDARVKTKNNLYTAGFHGVAFVINMNKNFNTNTIILPKDDKYLTSYVIELFIIFLVLKICSCSNNNIAYTLLICIFIIIGYSYKNLFQRVNSESIDFNKKYKIYTDNQIEARYILTPSFMERLNELNFEFDSISKNVRCAFCDNKIIILLKTSATEDIFEIGNLKIKASDSKIINRFYKQIMAITHIIDHFKLNEKTGL